MTLNREITKVSEVFKTTGQPTVTYVERDSGNLERRLSGYLDEAGQLCLITGPSKTGKTTLYRQVLQKRGAIPLIVQCKRPF
jgi:predicted AAA+ superfamily ATPase